MRLNCVIAGIGGQGVVFATKVLLQAALIRGDAVLASENHGMSQRGGSVQSHVKLGGSDSPLIRRGTADLVIAFDRVEALRNLAYVRAGGQVFVNSADGLEPPVAARLAEIETAVHPIDAAALAAQLGSPAVANVIVLGFAAAHGALGLSVDELKAAVRALGPAQAVDVNLKALEMGAAEARQANETV